MQEEFHQEQIKPYSNKSKDFILMKQLLFQSYSFRRKSIMGNYKLFVDLLTEFRYFEQQALGGDEFSQELNLVLIVTIDISLD
jgi:hypothetical protein